MIVTAKSKVPFLWLLLALLPWAAAVFQQAAMYNCYTFSLLKFVENPVGLGLILSLPPFLSMFIQPVVNFTADRIWTRWGRRKPFVVASWSGMIAAITVMPLMPNLWGLIACFTVYQIFSDLGGPMEQLKMEVVPPPQRGTSTAIANWFQNITYLTFNFVALGRFDDYQFVAGFPVTGEATIYWVAAMALGCMAMLIIFGIRETNPYSKLTGERFSLATFWRGISSHRLWPVYVLVTAYNICQVWGSGFGLVGQLLQIEEWKMTKQEMGINIAAGGAINFFLIAFVVFFAHKLDRMKWFLRLMLLQMGINVLYYIYLRHVLYDGKPAIVELVLFGETMCIVGIFIGVMYTPLVYDFISRNELGTFQAGQAITSRITSIILTNAVTVAIWFSSITFMPPGGDTVRVALREVGSNAQVEATLRQAAWTDPAHGGAAPPSAVSAWAWYATNAKTDVGRAFEVRLRDEDSVDQRRRRDALKEELAGLEVKYGKDAAGNAAYAAKSAEMAAIDRELERRSQHLRDQVVANLGEAVVRPGEQILAAAPVAVAVYEIPILGRPERGLTVVERTLRRLRELSPEVIDLRLTRTDPEAPYRMFLSARLEDGTDPADLGRRLAAAMGTACHPGLRPALAWPLVPGPAQVARGVALDLQIVEDPLDRHVSPVMTVWWGLLGLVLEEVPGPDRRIVALGRTLREPGLIEHAQVALVPGSESAIRVTALCTPPAAAPADAGCAGVDQRLEALLPGQEGVLAAARTLYRRSEKLAADQQMTIVRPVIGSGFKPMKRDYLAGYVIMFVLQAIAVVILIRFMRNVERGVIRRRGIEEMEGAQP